MDRRRRPRRIVKGRRWPRIVAIRTIFFALLAGLLIQVGVLVFEGPVTERTVVYTYIVAAGTAGFAWCWRQAVLHAGGITPAAYIGLAMVVAMAAIHTAAAGWLPPILTLLPLGGLLHAWYTDRRPATVYAAIVLLVLLAFGLPLLLDPWAIPLILAGAAALAVTVIRRYASDRPLPDDEAAE